MKTAIIYKSIHHGNTKKIAEVMANTLEADLFDLKDFNHDMIKEYDLIGFGSGIYFQEHHQKILKFVDELPAMDKKVFIFSTRAAFLPFRNPLKYHINLKNKLNNKNFEVIGEFTCRGLSTYYRVFRMIGGVNKGRPNERDLLNAENFANQIKEEK